MKRANRRYGAAGLLLVAALLSSCSGIPLVKREAAERARFEAYAGKPVNSYTWLVSYNGWEPISRHQLVVWTSFDDAYLVTVHQPCTDLMFAKRIGLTSFAGTVSANIDFVRADGWKCMIKAIQPIDYRRMLRDERKKAQAAKTSHTAD